jgi:hypothetical protein
MSKKPTDPSDVPFPAGIASDLDDTDFGDEDDEVMEVRPDAGGPLPLSGWAPPTGDAPPARAPRSSDSLSTLRPADESKPPEEAEAETRSATPRPIVVTQTRGASGQNPAPTPPPPPPKKPKKPKKKLSLADRARRPVSARQALASAVEEQRKKEEAAAPPPPAEVVQMACAALGDVQVRKIHILDDRKRLAERWLAHRARGVVRADFQLAVTAEVIMDAAARVQRGRLFGVEIDLEGRLYAAFIDAERVVLLALLEGPSVYLSS